MSASSDLQDAIVTLLQAEGALSAACPVLGRITGDRANDIDASVNKKGGLCIYVMPVLPLLAAACQGADFVFFDRAEVRVRIVEQPATNNYGVDTYDLIDDISQALHWQGIPGDGSPLGNILSHPLQIAEQPVDFREGIIEESQQALRLVDVLFIATFGFARRSPSSSSSSSSSSSM